MSDKKYAPRDWTQQPPYLYPEYKSTTLRSPSKPLVALPETLSELTGPVYGAEVVDDLDDDLTKNAVVDGPPLGERIVVEGRVLDENDNPVPHTVMEIWQANSTGRYVHTADQHDAPLDPNFFGSGRCITDENGCYRFTSIRPGCYPWLNHPKGFRPAHIHFSLFGPAFVTRLITQMYFPGDPLLALDPVFMAIPDAEARERLIAKYSQDVTVQEWALVYEFDIILRGNNATPME